ncbi:hypothetical protein BKA70DRAFT_465364 [Coprinopsis sp. MPI-PUGE-AT-0042]|nr:hypothetical protein BKA70DRAFT_465364 [Coprinopsis sp. MPI-PUGE-AT-0042]
MINRVDRELAPPGPTAPLYSPYDPACPELNVDHPLYWRYGQNAGGVVLTTQKFYGKKMRDVPWSFLVDCERMGRDTKNGCWELQLIFETYKKGLMAWVSENPEKYIIPDGVYRGEEVRMMNRYDLDEVLMKARFNPYWAEVHSLWVLAAREAEWRRRRFGRGDIFQKLGFCDVLDN